MVHLLWAIHNHQPVGNFDFIFARAHDRAYKPFLDVLERHARIRLSLHFSGILLDWLVENRPEYIARLKVLVNRGQVEVLGGGHYEPILPVLSDRDKEGQVKKLADTVEKVFGKRPRGMWLAERVWEPGLAAPLARAGMEYVVLDGSHFKMVGKTEKDMDGYFVTEDQGLTLKLFPIHDIIRDYIPFRSVEEVVGTLKSLNTADHVQVVFGDDGEKFGDWPFTYETVYEHGWLDRFFSAIEAEPDIFAIEPVSEGLLPEKNLGLVYLPPASYGEMMMWAQNATDISAFKQAQKALEDRGDLPGAGRFLRGTFWRNFFCKYPESNRIHKQAVRLSQQLDAVERDRALDAEDIAKARDHLWQAQCNCGYWHGVFGGLYLPHLRFALYQNLVACRRILDKALFSARRRATWESLDWDCDGKLEQLLETQSQSLSFNSQGAVNQFWLKRTGFNLSDTLTRRPEAYHAFIGAQGESGTKLENTLGSKEEGLRDKLVYDRETRFTGTDLFLTKGQDFQGYLRQAHHPIWRMRWQAPETSVGKTAAGITYVGQAVDALGQGMLEVKKHFSIALDGKSLDVEWTFSAPKARLGMEASGPRECRFASEWLFCLLAGNAPDRFITWDGGLGAGEKRDILASRGEMPPGPVTLTDSWLKFSGTVSVQGATSVWRDAIETVSQSEGGYERVYQGTVVVPVWDISLEPGQSLSFGLSLTFQEGN
jgi:4-alpha-glucanotransferase